MSMKSDDLGKGIAYFTDGHTEAITESEISKDGHEVWFTVESGGWFVYKEISALSSNGYFYPVYRFYKVWINRDHDEFGATCNVEHLVTDEIERIKICVAE